MKFRSKFLQNDQEKNPVPGLREKINKNKRATRNWDRQTFLENNEKKFRERGLEQIREKKSKKNF